MPVYMLLDNGSRRAEASLLLRHLARELGARTGLQIHPVSLQHADAIDPEALDGQPAWTLAGFLRHQAERGEREFVGLPLFFGASRALTAFIPQQLETLRQDYPQLRLRLADVTCPLPQGEPLLTRILAEHVQQARSLVGQAAKVVLVDHGSPSPDITRVRETLAQDLARSHGLSVAQAVMERREAPEYDFNGQLLQHWLQQQAELGVEDVIIAMLFFLPGRHAGACGDVDSICREVVSQYPGLRYTITPLIGEHPLLLELLAQRLHSTMQA